VVVPKDFITDFASVPRLPMFFLMAGGKGKRAAVVHDWLYTVGTAHPGTITRLQADQVLLEAMLASGYARVTAGMFYAAVRAGGSSHWQGENVPQEMHVDAAIEADALMLRAGG
jgi:hypothetical protein